MMVVFWSPLGFGVSPGSQTNDGTLPFPSMYHVMRFGVSETLAPPICPGHLWISTDNNSGHTKTPGPTHTLMLSWPCPPLSWTLTLPLLSFCAWTKTPLPSCHGSINLGGRPLHLAYLAPSYYHDSLPLPLSRFVHQVPLLQYLPIIFMPLPQPSIFTDLPWALIMVLTPNFAVLLQSLPQTLPTLA